MFILNGIFFRVKVPFKAKRNQHVLVYLYELLMWLYTTVWYMMQHRTVLIIFLLILQTVRNVCSLTGVCELHVHWAQNNKASSLKQLKHLIGDVVHLLPRRICNAGSQYQQQQTYWYWYRYFIKNKMTQQTCMDTVKIIQCNDSKT